ncbi:MAG: response regulator transcription factor [Taibaiella sp.]|jgi:DNA-binding NarL/FixJ family response regulator
MKINIAIADDHPMIIGGLKNLLVGYSHLNLVGTYLSGTELLEHLPEIQADVLLLDIQLPDKTGDTLAPVIIKQNPDLRILILTNLSSPLYLHNLLRMGVAGYILKNTDPDMLIHAIEMVHEGKEFIDPALQDKLLQFRTRMKKEVALKPALTLREKEILRMTVSGDTMPEISKKLFIGLRTVEYYRGNLFLKLEVKNLAGLIRKALELGLTE